MKVKALVQIAAFASALVIAAAPAGAQALNVADQEKVESVSVTPFASIGSHGSSQVGTAVTFPWTRTLSVEAEFGYRQAELNALSAHVSLVNDLPRIGRITPYFAAGLGLEQYGTAVALPSGSLGTQARTALFVNAGGGIKVPVDDTWGIRTDARWFNGIGRDAGEHWRVYNGVTWRTGR